MCFASTPLMHAAALAGSRLLPRRLGNKMANLTGNRPMLALGRFLDKPAQQSVHRHAHLMFPHRRHANPPACPMHCQITTDTATHRIAGPSNGMVVSGTTGYCGATPRLAVSRP
jgi:hypothetical protein